MWARCSTSCPTSTPWNRLRRRTCTKRWPRGSAAKRGPRRSGPKQARSTPSGAAHFAAVGGWIARTVGPRAALRIQAGALDLRDALGRPCAEALRLYGFLPFLETGAPHLLSDAFRPGRWWKLIDLWREATVARDFHDRLVAPLLAGGAARKQAWDEALDALAWCELPAWRDPPNAIDRDLAARADRALRVRTMRRGQGFVAARADPPGPMVLDREACELQAPWNTPDAFGAPPVFPWPPSLAAQRAD
jgi:hypothetical protein